MSKSEKSGLDSARASIDKINRQLLMLLGERAKLAAEIAKLKGASSAATAYYRPEREAEILHQMTALNPGPLPNGAVIRIFREIMSACLALEKPISVAYLGPPGTYSHEAVQLHFGGAVQECPVATLDEVFRDVERGRVDYGVVPVENSTEGAVTHSMDLFLTSKALICAEVELPIHHHLLSVGPLDQITRVCSHQQSLGQCRAWLAQHLPGVELEALGSNSLAARMARDHRSVAAIAGSAAAALYGLDTLAANIEDQADNTTRFLVIGRQLTQPSGHDKTSLVLSAGNRPGALAALLEPFSRHRISMSRIESRPSRQGRWDYVFFIDIEGHREDQPIARALEEIAAIAVEMHILGSYPRHVSWEAT